MNKKNPAPIITKATFLLLLALSSCNESSKTLDGKLPSNLTTKSELAGAIQKDSTAEERAKKAGIGIGENQGGVNIGTFVIPVIPQEGNDHL